MKQTKKQRSSTAPSTAPQSLRWFFSNPKSEEEGGGGGGGGGDKRGSDGDEGGLEMEGDTAFKGSLLAGVLLVGFVGGFAAVGYVYKDQINAFLSQFSTFIDGNFARILYPLRIIVNLGWILLVSGGITHVILSRFCHSFKVLREFDVDAVD